MKDYIVYVDITFSRSFNVSAESEEQAERMAESMADNCPTDQVRWCSYVGANAYDIEEEHPYGDN